MGWLIALGILTALCWLPLGLRLRYDQEGFRAWLKIGPAGWKVYPISRKPKKSKKSEAPPAPEQRFEPAEKTQPVSEEDPPKPEESKPAPEEPQPKSEEPKKQPADGPAPAQTRGGSLRDFMPLLQLGKRLLADARRKIRVNHLDLQLVLAAEDPCDLAVNYGRAWALMGSLMAHLERLFVIKKRNTEIQCDFTASEITLTAGLELTITLGRLLWLGLVYGMQALKIFLNMQKNRKGGVAV